jgi:hypothetical protein
VVVFENDATETSGFSVRPIPRDLNVDGIEGFEDETYVVLRGVDA